jgi:glycosyltransferase involved in cell wall biosynthesis
VAKSSVGNALPSTILATGPPFHDFVAGYFAAKWTQTSLTLDYRDEWSQSPFDFVSRTSADRRWERRCLAAADRIIFTTNSQRERLNAVYRETLNAHVIPNGWEPADDSGHVPVSSSPAWPLTLVFAGKLGGHTDPRPFLEALARLVESKPEWRSRIRVRLVGSKLASARAAMSAFPYPELLEDVPVVPRAEVVRIMRDADALLLFHDARFERYLPGKVYEYIATQKPTLAIDDIGETRDLLAKLDVGYAIASNDIAGLECVLNELVRMRECVHNAARDAWLAEHTRERLMQRFLSILHDD